MAIPSLSRFPILTRTEIAGRRLEARAAFAVLFVVHTAPTQTLGGELGTIISVRKATTTERRAYEEGSF